MRHLGENMSKAGGDLWEDGANDGSLEYLREGQENLLKILRVPGLEVFLEYGKKNIPQNPSNVHLNLFVQHPVINDGNKIMLFTTMARPPPTILQSGVLPGKKCLKDLADMPLMTELRDVLMALVKPLVDFAVSLDTLALTKKWKKDPTDDIPTHYRALVKEMAKMHKEQNRTRLAVLLSWVKTRVSVVDGEWMSSDLLIEMPDDSDESGAVQMPDDSDDSEAEDDSGAEDPWSGGRPGTSRHSAKRTRDSPAKSSTQSSSGSTSSKKGKKKAATDMEDDLAD
jgi:hypothetical protein